MSMLAHPRVRQAIGCGAFSVRVQGVSGRACCCSPPQGPVPSGELYVWSRGFRRRLQGCWLGWLAMLLELYTLLC